MAIPHLLTRRVPPGCFALALLIGAGCAPAPYSSGETEVSAAHEPANATREPASEIEHTARDLLNPTSTEETGFGLYSYLLFDSRPPTGSRAEDRHLAALQAFVYMVVPIAQSREHWEQQEINITYVPVRSDVEETPASLLANYDYARAQLLLTALPPDARPLTQGAGPYIVSYRRPLTAIARQGAYVDDDEYLFQDLSSVPARVVRLWVGEFLSQVRQPEYWRDRPMQDFALRLRTHLASLADFVDEVPPGLLRELASVLFAGGRA